MASAPPHEAACLTAEIEGIVRCLEVNIVGDSRNGGRGGYEAEPGDEKPAALLHKALHDLQEKLKVQFAMQRRLVEEKESLQATAAKYQEEADQLRSQLRDMTTVGVSPFACLPEELALHVFSFLEMKEVCTARLVCSRWSVLGNDEGLLQVLVAKRCIPPAQPRKPVIVERDWKWLYLSQSRVLKLDAEKPPGGVGSARLASGARYDGEWKEGKEHGYGIKFWPIVVDTKPQGGEQDIAAASSLPNATAGDGGEGAGGDTSDADAGQGGSGEESGGSRSAPHPASSSPRTKEPKTSIVEYDSYEGMWKDGWEHGVGKYTWADGSEYKGDWVEGKRSGQGIYVWPNRSTYTGEWRDGHQEGWGIYRWPSGSLYMGMWKNGNQDGWGMKRWGDSSWYEGEWSDGQKHGKGTYSWIDGRRYKGQWKHGKKHGVGSYLWSDGTTYEGEWDLGLRHGRGVMRFIDGSVFDGVWWKDRRLKPGEDGSATEKEKLTYEKPYDHYFCEPDDFWEQKYRADIDARAAERRLEMEETKRRRKEIKKHCAEIQKRFQHY